MSCASSGSTVREAQKLLEKLFRLLKKTLRQGRFVAVTHGGKFLKLGFLLVVQACGHFHLYPRMQVAMTIALQVFYSFTFHSKDRPRLCARGNFNHRLAFERG